MTFGNNITIEGWVKLGSATTPNTILNKGAGSFDYQLGINSSTTGSPFFRAGATVVTATTIVIPVNVWTHVAVTCDGSNAIFYMNGVPAAPVAMTTALGTSTGEMRIGRGNNDPGSGKIDELRLWSVARSGAQIVAEMCTKWIPLNTSGLKAVWHLDSTLVDSVSGFNGTPNGNITYDTANNCVVTGLQNLQSELPKQYYLSQNYPNPFNPVTKINFAIPRSGLVVLKVYDILGKEVATLVNDVKHAGSYLIDFNGSALSSGIYFYRLESNGYVNTKKMMLIK
jgi:hypothetical protein